MNTVKVNSLTGSNSPQVLLLFPSESERDMIRTAITVLARELERDRKMINSAFAHELGHFIFVQDMERIRPMAVSANKSSQSSIRARSHLNRNRENRSSSPKQSSGSNTSKSGGGNDSGGDGDGDGDGDAANYPFVFVVFLITESSKDPTNSSGTVKKLFKEEAVKSIFQVFLEVLKAVILIVIAWLLFKWGLK